jgi:hypothetical protein
MCGYWFTFVFTDEPKSKKQKPESTNSTNKKAAGKKPGKVSSKVKGKERSNVVYVMFNIELS